MNLLENKIALVTSSTRGIGLACAKKLAEHKAKVYLAVRRLDAGKNIANEIIAAGGWADVVYFDAMKHETYSAMIEELIAKEGKIDILVNNYGATDVKVDFDLVNGDTESFFDIVEQNMRSVYVPSKSAVQSMIKTGGGSIINISSVGGMFPDVTRLAYGTAKAAINFITKNIAVQYAKQNIRCNAVLPGYIETDAAADNMSPEFLSTFIKTVPLNRVGKPEDIANAVLYLASDMSSFITGETIPVAGGFGLPSPMYPFYGDMKSKG
ncbi:NAD(P)-dependent dehydrogenase, short-chain alcohol dehydrogenase family [Desulfonispora thiosulfatigenes DSM 11270]|uniref:NAD(P)-dependent dehydrogenase, short-chain alcohol dehydrogenase family n=1 Tax=Desulfonispora thiosulfatigenes DSM 11270 TaxID=656914 RepID=A0A1W1UEM7_DESTI|nr:SDR family NAD(P)-dependent oxidoreductase [Desulfonispora thiosulfatigenes]SMB79555.1 NAD(P)-dependent dehydrogenase, short-chain alcohol dehydrogenase family [Desulfonispora thiosulfatigenes DSM 11270]